MDCGDKNKKIITQTSTEYLSPHIKKEHKIKIYGHCHKEEKKKYLQWTFSMNRLLSKHEEQIAQYFCKYQKTTTRKLYILAYFFVREDPLKKKKLKYYLCSSHYE